MFVAYRHLYPPVRQCTVCHGTLKEPVKHKATLFTLREGALPVYVTSLFCRRKLISHACIHLANKYIACKRSYHHNFHDHAASGIRTYYGGVPDVVQVAKHYFMDVALLEFFATSKTFAWFVISFCICIFTLVDVIQ